MIVRHRLFRAEEDGVAFPQAEVDKLVGQRPRFVDDATQTEERFEVKAAAVIDGWVTVDLDVPSVLVEKWFPDATTGGQYGPTADYGQG